MKKALRTIHFDGTGPMIRYGEGSLWIDDLNPESHMRWAMNRGELFSIGWRCIKAALFGSRS